ncbi:MAG: diguanylate cyclase, partial [Gallionellaceae bacterium]|nr:diguanylate cyclase [Gallionellaceae bacterium]
MKLRAKFLLLMTLIFIGFILSNWFLSDQLANKLNQQWGEQFAARQVMFDKYRTLAPLIREIALARQMAAEPAIIDMALHENDPEMRRKGLAAMEKYRFNFRDHSYFAAFAKSGHYYYNDAKNQYAGNQLRYVLSATEPKDKWFYATLIDGKEYQVNIDPDAHLKVTKAWINVLIKNGNETLGIIGTGIDLTDLINETVNITQPGINNLFIDKSMAIQLNSDPKLIDYMSIAKDVGQRIKVDVLLKNSTDIDHLRNVLIELERTPEKIATLEVDYQGNKHLLGVAYLPEIGWYDLTLISDHSLNLFDYLFIGPVLFGTALLLALLAVGWALRCWILKPIEVLRASTDKIRNGHFEVDPAITGTGEIAHLSQSFERMAKFVIESNRELEEKVRERTEALQHLSEIDPLTGLLNRRGMTERFENEIARQSRQGGSMGMLLLDLDHFKHVND